MGSESQQNPNANKQDKKYIILSYEGEFEKVHYPLPLHCLEEPEMDQMFKTFSRLQSAMQMSRTG